MTDKWGILRHVPHNLLEFSIRLETQLLAIETYTLTLSLCSFLPYTPHSASSDHLLRQSFTTVVRGVGLGENKMRQPNLFFIFFKLSIMSNYYFLKN